MHLFKRHNTEYNLIAKSKFFDKRWYLKTYPDVAAAGMDPVEHYLKHGWCEGRNPSSKFNGNEYLNINTDVKSANINPLLHYEMFGHYENRPIACLESISTTQKSTTIDKFFTQSYKAQLAKTKQQETAFFSNILSASSIEDIYSRIKKHNFNFRSVDKPLVSIIIPVYNQYKYTLACLYYIEKHTSQIPYEIILVDDNSTDETIDIENRVPNINVIRNKTNKGFLYNCNIAAKSARGDYIALLNNDILVSTNWLEFLLNAYSAFPEAAVVGGQLIFPNGKIQESGRKIFFDGTSYNKYNNLDMDKFDASVRSVHYCSGCLLLIDKLVWDELGGFDTRFTPAYYEDNDFCMAVREKLGRLVLCEPKCKAIHFHNVSYKQTSNNLSEINRQKFLKKWDKELQKPEYNLLCSEADINAINQSLLFDPYYYETNYNVKEHGVEHYLSRGWKKGYNPSKFFDTKFYLNNNDDVASKNLNPLLHYIKYGQTEGRAATTKDINIKFRPFLNYIDYINSKPSKKILLISHSFSLTGAPLAVFHTAKYFKNLGWDVVVIGFDNRELVKYYKQENITVFADPAYNFVSPALTKYLKAFDFIFVNTVLGYRWVNVIPNSVKYIWRIAEGKDIDTKFAKTDLFNTLKKSNSLYAVSKYTQNILRQFNPSVNLLLYGVKEVVLAPDKAVKDNNIIKFVVVGNYCARKGQDLIFDAVSALPQKYKTKMEFIFMGEGFHKFKDTANFKFVGVKRDLEKYKIIQSADILLCPSLDDPNPQVVMEGMMMHKPCIVTDCTGQKDYIQNGESGWVIKAGDVKDLQNLLIKLMRVSKRKLKIMGGKSYTIWRKYFKLEDYLNKVKQIVCRKRG